MTKTKTPCRKIGRLAMSKSFKRAAITGLLLAGSGCVPALVNGGARAANKEMPASYSGAQGSAADGGDSSSGQLKWSEFFSDPKLNGLIDVALKNNQELNIVSLEVDLAQNEVMSRQGDFLPKLSFKAGAGLEKVGRYTSQGAADELTGVPQHLPDFGLGLFASWEIDVWKKLRNATKAATLRYLGTLEGRHFTITVLVSEIASTYYELLALDAQLDVVKQNVALQQDALAGVKLQKEAARVTELAVKRFEAEVLKNQGRQFAIQKDIINAEQRINFLLGRFPQHVERTSGGFKDMVPAVIHQGLPSQMLENRPDVKRAELDLAAAELDVQVAKANFYPTIGISAGVGVQAFDILKLVTTPASIFYNLAGDFMAPLLNRKGITANYFSANTKQMQAVFNYERAILKGFTEAATQLATIENLEKGYEFRSQEVDKLNESIEISTGLFKSARADYVEVLMTRRDSLESQMELIETKKQQMLAVVNVYRALGGGWK